MLTEIHGERAGLATAAGAMTRHLELIARIEQDLVELLFQQRKNPALTLPIAMPVAPGMEARTVLDVPIADLIKAVRGETQRLLSELLKDMIHLQEARQRLEQFNAVPVTADESLPRLVGSDRSRETRP